MSGKKDDGGSAFPHEAMLDNRGMSLRDWFAGMALSNLCTGTAPEWQLRAWFGERTGITREEIASRQAFAFADAMLKARNQ